eukprot:Nk52_evm1s1096 gene=Nk52_evmTU1s1096
MGKSKKSRTAEHMGHDDFATVNNMSSHQQGTDKKAIVEQGLSSLDYLERNTAKPGVVGDEILQEEVNVGKSAYIYVVTLFATIGGLLFGYDIGIMGGVIVMDDFRDEFDWPRKVSGKDDPQDVATAIGWVVSVFNLGCFASALFGGTIADRFGRRFAIFSAALVFCGGGLIQGFAKYRWMLYVGRVVAGLGNGILSLVVPMYNSELSAPKTRGMLVGLQQLAITFGILVAFLVNLAFQHKHPDGWRYSLIGQSVFGAILVIGVYALPESPRWLIKHGKDDLATGHLKRLRGVTNVDVEFTQIKQTVEYEEAIGKGEWADLFKQDMLLRVIIGVMIQFFQQMTGMNAIMYYSATIFEDIGIDGITTTAVTGGVNFLSTFLALYLVDVVGRRRLLLWGASGMFLCAAWIGIIGFAFDPEDNTIPGYIVVVLICCFIVNFAYSWGPCGWIIPSEIYPLRQRGKAMSVTTSSNWIGNFAIAQITPMMLSSALGLGGTFFFFSFWLVIMFIFIATTLPETKGRTLEEMDIVFNVRNMAEYRGHVKQNLSSDRLLFSKSDK